MEPQSELPSELSSRLQRQGKALGIEFVKQRVKRANTVPDMSSFREESRLSTEIIELCGSMLDTDRQAMLSHQGFKDLAWRAVAKGRSVAVIIEWLRELENLIQDFLFAQTDSSLPEVRKVLNNVSTLFNELCNHQLEIFEDISDELAGWRTRVSSDMVSYLVSGTAVVSNVVNEQAVSLAVDPKKPFRAIAVHIDPLLMPTQKSQIIRRLMRFVQEINDQVCPLVQHRNELFIAIITPNLDNEALVAKIKNELLTSELKRYIYVATGESVDQLSSAGKSCRQALSTLEIAMYREARGEVSQCTDNILEVLLYHNEWVSRRIVKSRLGSLLGKEQLIETLRAYIRCDMSLQKTADELYVHPNTVSYRLRQISTTSGKDMRSLTDLIDLAVALDALDILKINETHSQGQMGLKTMFLSGHEITYQ